MIAPTSSSTAGLVFKKVSLRLDDRLLLTLDHAIRPGTVLTVMGESGSGKSTLLDFIAGFLKPDFTASGQILLDGKDITSLPPQNRHIGLMFQTPLLFPHMSVLQNLMFAIPQHIKDKNKRRSLAEEALQAVGLSGSGLKDPAKLSGGQQTRIALMRTLLAEPKALLLDEPFSSLDQSRRATVRELVFSVARNKNLPVLLVTHDEEDAEVAGGQVFRLENNKAGHST
ncbi:ATP-binding cassette domain-containing protein [Roseibium sp.]|uniref:ATP-binding cassette domain-containing protein n=1 Tax=Roseibium sp. TaxID=1936156 RepID=UPI003B528F37